MQINGYSQVGTYNTDTQVHKRTLTDTNTQTSWNSQVDTQEASHIHVVRQRRRQTDDSDHGLLLFDLRVYERG